MFLVHTSADDYHDAASTTHCFVAHSKTLEILLTLVSHVSYLCYVENLSVHDAQRRLTVIYLHPLHTVYFPFPDFQVTWDLL